MSDECTLAELRADLERTDSCLRKLIDDKACSSAPEMLGAMAAGMLVGNILPALVRLVNEVENQKSRR